MKWFADLGYYVSWGNRKGTPKSKIDDHITPSPFVRVSGTMAGQMRMRAQLVVLATTTVEYAHGAHSFQYINGATIVCTDDCPTHGDGDCDDGGRGASFSDCSFGSDCTDCGQRVLNPPTYYNFSSRSEVRTALQAMTSESDAVAIATYGYVETWDTRAVTDMNHLFHGYCNTFNDDIGDWDTSSVTNMHGMFDECFEFDQDISRWDTSRVTSMYQMFQYASRFSHDISGWDTRRVTSFREMFPSGTALSLTIKCALSEHWHTYLGWPCPDVSPAPPFPPVIPLPRKPPPSPPKSPSPMPLPPPSPFPPGTKPSMPPESPPGPALPGTR